RVRVVLVDDEGPALLGPGELRLDGPREGVELLLQVRDLVAHAPGGVDDERHVELLLRAWLSDGGVRRAVLIDGDGQEAPRVRLNDLLAVGQEALEVSVVVPRAGGENARLRVLRAAAA